MRLSRRAFIAAATCAGASVTHAACAVAAIPAPLPSHGKGGTNMLCLDSALAALWIGGLPAL